DFELFTRFLIDVRRPQNSVFLNAGRQRNRAADLCASALRRIDDLARGLIQHAMVKRLQANANVLTIHVIMYRSPQKDTGPSTGVDDCRKSVAGGLHSR